MDAVTAVSGSGPPTLFLLAEAMIDAGIAEVSAARAPRARWRCTPCSAPPACSPESGVDAGELRRRTCTPPNGTTQAALDAFEAGGFAPWSHPPCTLRAYRGMELSADND